MEKFDQLKFLSEYWPVPDPDRTEPFRPLGATGVTDFRLGFPDEALIDRKFPRPDNGRDSSSIEYMYHYDHALKLVRAYHGMGVHVGWLGLNKRPVTGLKQGAPKQGVSGDIDFLAKTFRDTQNRNVEQRPTLLCYHTGVANGHGFVHDLDLRPDSNAVMTFFAYLEKHCVDPRQFPAILTPGLGLHLYSLPPEDVVIKCRSSFAPETFGPRVDSRGRGFYVAAAGTWGYDGKNLKQYFVLNNVPLKPLPECILDVYEQKYGRKPAAVSVPDKVAMRDESGTARNASAASTSDGGAELDMACRIMAATPEGSRNTRLNAMSFAMGKKLRDDASLSEDDVREKLGAAAEASGLEGDEIQRTIESGLKAGLDCDQPYVPFNSSDRRGEAAPDCQVPSRDSGVGSDQPVKAARSVPASPWAPRAAAGSAPLNPAAPASLWATRAGLVWRQDQHAVGREPVPRPQAKPGAPAVEREDDSCRYSSVAERNFLKDLSYRRGRMGAFANRLALVSDCGTINEISSHVFPRGIHEILAEISDEYRIGQAELVQFCIVTACNIVKNARRTRTGNASSHTMPCNLFAMIIGEPSSKKSFMESFFLSAVRRREREEREMYLEELEEYRQAKEKYDKAKDKNELEEPVKPVPRPLLADDATIEAVVDRVQDVPEGIWWHKDEGAGQKNMGGARYNQNNDADLQAKLICAFQGDPVTVDRKSHEGQSRNIYLKEFTLGVTKNLQPEFVKTHFNALDEAQGYLQRYCFILMPPQPDGKEECGYQLEDEGKVKRYEYLDAVLDKLLDMRLKQFEKGERNPNEIRFTKEGLELYKEWYNELTDFCRYGSLKAYTVRFAEQVVRMAAGLHYLHLAAESVESGICMNELEERNPCLTEADVKRAIEVSDIFMDRLDRFLWMLKKPKTKQVANLGDMQQTFAKEVIGDPVFYAKPRTAKEILEHGFETKMSPRKLTWWLKREGFESELKGRDRFFELNGLKPWQGAAELDRFAFDESEEINPVRQLYLSFKEIEAADYRVTEEALGAILAPGNQAADGTALARRITPLKNTLHFSEADGVITFTPETPEACARILKRDGLITADGKLLMTG